MNKNILLTGFILFLGCQSPYQLLDKGIKNEDYKIIEKAVAKGADPSIGILESVKENNLDLTKYLLEKGAKFISVEEEVIDGQVYIGDGKNNLIPIKIVTENGKNKRYYEYDSIQIRLENQKVVKLENVEISGEGLIVYKTKKINTGNPSLIYAIKNKNLEMIKLLKSYGIAIHNECVVSKLKDFRHYDVPFWGSGYLKAIENGGAMKLITNSGYIIAARENGYFISNITPTPEVIMTPLQYAKATKASSEIINELQ